MGKTIYFHHQQNQPHSPFGRLVAITIGKTSELTVVWVVRVDVAGRTLHWVESKSRHGSLCAIWILQAMTTGYDYRLWLQAMTTGYDYRLWLQAMSLLLFWILQAMTTGYESSSFLNFTGYDYRLWVFFFFEFYRLWLQAMSLLFFWILQAMTTGYESSFFFNFTGCDYRLWVFFFFEFYRLWLRLFDWFCLVSDLSKCLLSNLSKCLVSDLSKCLPSWWSQWVGTKHPAPPPTSYGAAR